ncbi:MAG TPA: hypothetical protein VFO39_14095 [Candidatus Sulfotelmatobacter sp.]|nr:hypothetical protein [Candidatus Sulfotelmatobacter sp.]
MFVDAMLEKDPYKRLALVRELREMPKPEIPVDKRNLQTFERKAKARIVRHR